MLKEFINKYPNAFYFESFRPSEERMKALFKSKQIPLLSKCELYLEYVFNIILWKIGLKKTVRLVSFDCGNGWKPLVEEIAKKLEETPDIYFFQVKEKFGGLRIYLNTHNEELSKMIHNLEIKSFKTCEDCGCKEHITTSGSWQKTLCNNCRATR